MSREVVTTKELLLKYGITDKKFARSVSSSVRDWNKDFLNFTIALAHAAPTSSVMEMCLALEDREFAEKFVIQGKKMASKSSSDYTTAYSSDAGDELESRVSWARNWAAEGFNIYRLSHSVTSKLLLTELPDFPLEDFRPPYSAFRVIVPEGFFGITTIEGNRAWAKIIDVVRVPPFEPLPHCAGEKDGIFANIIKTTSEDLVPGSGFGGMWRLWVGMNCYERHGPLLVSFRPERADRIKDLVNTSSDFLKLQGDEIEIETSKRASACIVNLVHAIVHNALTPVPARVSKAAVKRAVVRPRIFEFHVSKMPSNMIRAAISGEGRTGWRIKKKFVVRGHWREQPCGPRGSQRKRIWIDPYWKGPEGDEGWARITEVSDET